jgi:glycosyltransferase involved in cell wall biosynthesis
MRIGFVPAARLISETEPNGEALIAASLLRELAARGHEVVAYCERADLGIAGVQIRAVSAHGPTAALSRIAFARRVARAAARERFDLVHLLFPLTTADGYTLVNRAPLVCGPINLPWPESARTPRLPARAVNAITDRVERRWHERTLRRAARLLLTGPSSLQAMPASLRDRCVELPFGVDTERFPTSPLPEEPVILFFSVLQERKGIETLVEAMPAVRERIPAARLSSPARTRRGCARASSGARGSWACPSSSLARFGRGARARSTRERACSASRASASPSA